VDEETKDGKHRWPTEFICRLERHARPSATASPRDGMSGSRAPSLQEHDVIFGREVEQPSGRVRYEAALDGGCRVKHHGQGQQDVPGWTDDAGEPRASRPTRLARDRNRQGGTKNRREPAGAPSGGRVIEKQLETYCDVMARNTRRPSPRWGGLPRETRWTCVHGDPKKPASMWSVHDVGFVMSRV